MTLRHQAFLLVQLAALCGGCAAVGTPHSATSYYEHDGMWCGNYAVGYEGARVAVLTALTELKMPVDHEGPHHQGLYIDTRTPEGLEARILIVPPHGHAEGTRVCVRVGGFGTHPGVCERLLDAITRHIDAGQQFPMAPAPGALPQQLPSSELSLPAQPARVD